MELRDDIQTIEAELIQWRNELHAWPETAFEEIRTSDFIAEKLESFGLAVKRGIGKTGLVGTLEKGDAGREEAIALRADMDGLDIQEENDVDYKSKNAGKMHACGHDGHMTMLLGAARILSQTDDFHGRVHFIFQPAEENEGGGQVMIRDGLFDTFPVKSVFGMHNFPQMPMGYFAIRKGPMMAAFDIFDITVKGEGSHAAMPHMGKDPIVAAAHMVTQFQSIVGRNVNPVESAVVSVTDIHGGTTYNIIPDIVSMRGTTRHFLPTIQDLVKERIEEIANGAAASMGVSVDVNYEKRYPALVNSPEETDQAIKAASDIVGTDHVIPEMPPTMGAEDFAFMLQKVPGAYICLGGGTSQTKGLLHQSTYNFNDELLTLGVSYWVQLVENLFPF